VVWKCALFTLANLELELETELAATNKPKKDAIKEKESSKKTTAATDHTWDWSAWDDEAATTTTQGVTSKSQGRKKCIADIVEYRGSESDDEGACEW